MFGSSVLQLHLRKPEVIANIKPTKKMLDSVKINRQTFWATFRKLPASTQSALKRCVFGIILLSYFVFIIYGGPIIILLTTLAAQIKCFQEIISIAYKKYDISEIASFRYISIYFVICANVYFGGENLLEHFHPFLASSTVLQNYHRFISFCLYFIGVIWFVLSLKKNQYRKQFSLLAWTHIILLVVVVQSYLIVKTIFQGMIWFIICITTITCNDITAYICGKFFGKTPLIKLSPKKTREGFIGAAICTILITCTVAYYLSGKEYFVCPIEYKSINSEIVKITNCEPDAIFKLQTYKFFNFSFEIYPFVLHALCLAIFGSLIAPFGGFFASGFKRAFKVKDFGDTIPGHGGLMDRFDCQLVMVTFVNVYITSFVSGSNEDGTFKVFKRITGLKFEQQIEVFEMLRRILIEQGVKIS